MTREQTEIAIAAMRSTILTAALEECVQPAQQVLRELNVPDPIVARASSDAIRYCGRIDHLPSIQCGDILVHGGREFRSHSTTALPGVVVNTIGLLPIASEQDGAEYFMNIVSGDVMLLPFEWFDDEDPNYLQEAYCSDTARITQRTRLTIENIMNRDPLTIESLEAFFKGVVSVTYGRSEHA